MILYRKIAGSIVLVFIGLFEIAERAAFVKEHLPRWITMHSDVTVISLLMVLCFYLMFGNREKNQSTKTLPMPKISNAPAGGSATATAEGGKIVQHLHFPNSLSIPPENGTKHKHNVRYWI
ncbi:MAG: hypothetical protein KGM96_08750 [Acidobacteriota bacterium]|nr:hypothetical protein [Acidobacteriota bacterium]